MISNAYFSVFLNLKMLREALGFPPFRLKLLSLKASGICEHTATRVAQVNRIAWKSTRIVTTLRSVRLVKMDKKSDRYLRQSNESKKVGQL